MDKHLILGDASCYYSDEGQGEALVFLHGFCEDATMWDHFKQPFVDSHRVICVDLPGYYRSQLPSANYTMELLAEYVNAILTTENIDKATFVGHSMGGYVALALAAVYPFVVSKMVLFHSHAFADNDEKRLNRQKTITFIQNQGLEPFLKELYRNLFAPGYTQTHAAVVDSLVERGKTYNAETVINGLKGMMNRPNRAAVLKNMAVPVLFIVGQEDTAVPYETSLKQSYLPAVAMLEVLPDVGHMGMYEATEKTQQVLEKFITLFD